MVKIKKIFTRRNDGSVVDRSPKLYSNLRNTMILFHSEYNSLKLTDPRNPTLVRFFTSAKKQKTV